MDLMHVCGGPINGAETGATLALIAVLIGGVPLAIFGIARAHEFERAGAGEGLASSPLLQPALVFQLCSATAAAGLLLLSSVPASIALLAAMFGDSFFAEDLIFIAIAGFAAAHLVLDLFAVRAWKSLPNVQPASILGLTR
jgi:hypothetical protein